MPHPRNPGWRKGDHWLRCDTCGFDYRFSDMKKRWDGYMVCKWDWEPRHPQDYVKGRKDRQAVPVARPEGLDLTDTTTLNANAAAGATSLTLADASGVSQYDTIGITLDQTNTVGSLTNNPIHWTDVATAPVGNDLTITTGIPSAASSGNTVY